MIIWADLYLINISIANCSDYRGGQEMLTAKELKKGLGDMYDIFDKV